MADEPNPTQVSADPAPAEAGATADPDAGLRAQYEALYADLPAEFRSSLDPVAPAEAAPEPATPAEPAEPAEGETPEPGDDKQPPSRRGIVRELETKLTEAEQRERAAEERGAERERQRLETEQRNAELEARLAQVQQQQDEAIQKGVAQLGTAEEREQLYRTLRTADAYTDEYQQAKDRLDEMDRAAEVFSIHEQVVHRAVMGSAYQALFQKAVEHGIDPRGINPNDPKITVGDHIRTIADAVVKARDEHWKQQIDDAHAQIETLNAKLAGHLAELPTGGRSARANGNPDIGTLTQSEDFIERAKRGDFAGLDLRDR